MPHRFDINVPIAIFTGNKEPSLNLEGFNQLLEELAKDRERNNFLFSE